MLDYLDPDVVAAPRKLDRLIVDLQGFHLLGEVLMDEFRDTTRAG